MLGFVFKVKFMYMCVLSEVPAPLFISIPGARRGRLSYLELNCHVGAGTEPG